MPRVSRYSGPDNCKPLPSFSRGMEWEGCSRTYGSESDRSKLQAIHACRNSSRSRSASEPTPRCSASFSSVLLKSWPFRDSTRLLMVSQRRRMETTNLLFNPGFSEVESKAASWLTWQRTFPGSSTCGSPGNLPERVEGGQVSYDWLRTLGVEPLLGRPFSPQEDVAARQLRCAQFGVMEKPLRRRSQTSR